MSRPKSEATIQRERDREIRRERRELKRQEREARRTERERKQKVREGLKDHDIPPPQIPDDGSLGLRRLVGWSPRELCTQCHALYPAREMIGSLCERCHYTNELGGENPDVAQAKKQGDKGLPVAGEREVEPIAPDGQLTLRI